MKFIKFKKIKQFRNIVREISSTANFRGLDNDGEPIYEETKKPEIEFMGTVKLHGTNAGVCYHPDEGIRAQKRSNFVPEDHLNAHFEFSRFVYVTKKEFFEDYLNTLWNLFCKLNEKIILFGEWAGKGVQKGVGISELNKSFYIFGLKTFNIETEKEEYHPIGVNDTEIEESNIYNITQFPTYSINIDFNNPGLTQNKLIEITESVEKECPVAKQLGVSGIGEGIVWTGTWKDEIYMFKVKGEKHSTSKVKTLASINPEVLKSIQEFVDYACSSNRIEQGIQEVDFKDKSDTPKLLKWVANDIISEENDVLNSNELEWKQVAKDCNNRIKQYAFNKLNFE